MIFYSPVQSTVQKKRFFPRAQKRPLSFLSLSRWSTPFCLSLCFAHWPRDQSCLAQKSGAKKEGKETQINGRDFFFLRVPKRSREKEIVRFGSGAELPPPSSEGGKFLSDVIEPYTMRDAMHRSTQLLWNLDEWMCLLLRVRWKSSFCHRHLQSGAHPIGERYSRTMLIWLDIGNLRNEGCSVSK